MGEETQEEKYYKVLLKERELLIDAAREGSRALDKAILTLSGGSIAISLTFINDIVPHFKIETKCYLNWSWGLFAISILLTLFSFWTSQQACSRQIEIVDGKIRKLHKTSETDESELKNGWTAITNLLNIISIVSFVVGIILLIYFVSINLSPKSPS